MSSSHADTSGADIERHKFDPALASGTQLRTYLRSNPKSTSGFDAGSLLCLGIFRWMIAAVEAAEVARHHHSENQATQPSRSRMARGSEVKIADMEQQPVTHREITKRPQHIHG